MNRLNWTLSHLLACFAALILAACSGARLPEPALDALNTRVEELTGLETTFDLRSVQKASGGPEDINLDNLQYKPDDFVNGCLPDLGGEESWCVALDRELATEDNLIYSHFIIQRYGQFWTADALTPDEAYATFYMVGCNNWDTLPVASK